MHMMERVIDVDRAAEVDFGVGNDPYKSHWASQQWKRWSLVALEPRTLRGALEVIRHLGGRKMNHAMAKCPSAKPRQ